MPVDLADPALSAAATSTDSGAHKHAVRAIWLRRTVYNAHDAQHRALLALELATIQQLRLLIGDDWRVVSILVASAAGERLIGMRNQRSITVP